MFTDNGGMDTPVSETLVALARQSAVDVAGDEYVGDHLGLTDDSADGNGSLVSLHFACQQPGYQGWFWSVSVTPSSGADAPTINDVVLLPGDHAIVAPDWTPYRERIRPGDLSPGDILPPEEDDLRLVPAWSAGDDQDTVDRYFAREVGLGRTWVLSLAGRSLAADRWMDGDFGPAVPMADQAPGRCASCGFLLSMAGSISDHFGVCANGMANADGRVVALGHGCGAHSQAKLSRAAAPQELPPPVFDTVSIDEVEAFQLGRLAVSAPSGPSVGGVADGVAADEAVLDADEAESEAGDSSPEPPAVAG